MWLQSGQLIMPKLPGKLMLTIISWREARANKALLAKFKSGGLTSASNLIHGGDLNRPKAVVLLTEISQLTHKPTQTNFTKKDCCQLSWKMFSQRLFDKSFISSKTKQPLNKSRALHTGHFYLEVLIRQVDLQAEGIHSLRQRPSQEIGQRICGLTEPGQHILHQNNLMINFCLLETKTIQHNFFELISRRTCMRVFDLCTICFIC